MLNAAINIYLKEGEKFTNYFLCILLKLSGLRDFLLWEQDGSRFIFHAFKVVQDDLPSHPF